MKLAETPDKIEKSYDVLVVGSGYGASVAAARAAEGGFRVCVLERGREFKFGQFPETLRSGLRELQLNGGPNPNGLFQLDSFRDLNIFRGCGLGGGSLINAGVAEKADPELFENPAWPEAFRRDGNKGLEAGYERAQRMLRTAPFPENQAGLPVFQKQVRMKDTARVLGSDYRAANLTINFDRKGYDDQGTYTSPCIHCGNCLSGCNHGAKQSLDKNYLPFARNHGARIFTGMEVVYLRKTKANDYLIYYRNANGGSSELRVLRARYVFLGAGSPGSAEILLRSRKLGGLAISDMLGRRFSANSGTIGAIFGARRPENAVGLDKNSKPDRRYRAAPINGKDRRAARPPVPFRTTYRKPPGPTITSLVKQKGEFLVEDAAAPGILSPLVPVWWAAGAVVSHGLNGKGPRRPGTLRSALRSLIGGAYREKGAVQHGGLLLGVGHDSSNGRIRLDNESDPLAARADILWPGLTAKTNYRKMSAVFRRISRHREGIYSDYTNLTGLNPITVHPLGGCAMGEDARTGVVNHAGAVFNPDEPGELHEGLFVCDASVFPTSVGTNPLLTITAMAERSLALFLEQTPAPEKSAVASPRDETEEARADRRTVLRIPEQLRGYWARGAADFQAGQNGGKNAGLSGRLTLDIEIEIDDLETFINEEGHEARVLGRLDCPGLDNRGPMVISDGLFRLFAKDTAHLRNRSMDYVLQVISADGAVYRVRGEKDLQPGTPVDGFREMLLLNIIVEQESEDDWREIGRGVMEIDFADFLKGTVAGMRGEGDWIADLTSRLKLGRFFVEETSRIYLPRPPVRGTETLRPGAVHIARHTLEGIREAEITDFPFLSSDGLGLRMRRVRRGAGKDAVLLIHGLTSSCDMFIMPEHENLTNYLLDHGREVWLLDFRMSNRFDYNTMDHSYTLDDVAMHDMPAALKLVREHIGDERRLDVVAHCLGSLSFSMALFGGFIPTRVDSLISNAVSLCVELPMLSAAKLSLVLKNGLLENTLRIDTLRPESLFGNDWALRLIAGGVSLFSRDCDDGVCHMLNFMWGNGPSAVFRHENLHEQTHNRLADLFGPTNMRYYHHVLKLHENPRRSLPFQDKPGLPADYLQSGRDNTVPTMFMAGEQNGVFGQSQKVTCEKLRAFRPDIYDLRIFKNYAHQDVFIGRNAAADVFPEFLRFWERVS